MSHTHAPHTVETTNYEKYQTQNPVVRRLIDGFIRQVGTLLAEAAPTRLLDAGCGEGETLSRLRDQIPDTVVGVDLNDECVRFASERLPEVEFRQGSVLELPFEDGAFDGALCLEVLEHLDTPDRALAELARVVRGGSVVLSVPHEQYFRLGSLARGKHIRAFGNHPEHVNHWNPRTFADFVSGHLTVQRVETAFPWIVVLATADKA